MKTFIGPRLRRLRIEHGQTQVQMAKELGISTSYVNLLEKNERSVSVPVLLKLFEAYGVDWRDIAEDDDTAALADIRAALQDPLFEGHRPDLPQLRASLAHSPDLAQAFVMLHRAYLAATDQLMSVAAAGEESVLPTAPEAVVHNVFRRHDNHFPRLEAAAEAFWDAPVAADDMYFALKSRLRQQLGLRVRIAPVAEMPASLREYDQSQGEVRLSEALDHPNRLFQLVHVAGLLEQADLLDAILTEAGLEDAHGRARCRVELANYFAAAVLMPYDRFLAEARASKYDFDHLATRFGVSFEQACHRATTLQRTGHRGIPFFFLRIDKAGNVTKRFNATDFHLAEYGGACPRLEVHSVFRTPGRIVPQVVEMPDRSQFFVFARTVDRPTFTRHAQDIRLAVAMGCARDHADALGYAEDLNLTEARPTEIGINCRICPRANCDQRAHQALVLSTPVDTARRGATRYAT
ncbi:helix-turn-helix domain-containing protein [Sagittula stellata]|uniref:Transcriptional regulator, XRE family protein n=1 Tax=Sagittula stellata (strain ATCC 700073 / DSM 11524 / E-37) TaxID=388399 RepID=A3K625_SAGS3|nr:helix-turn-helix transcriptional regulator [Sagittula stellata]EBA07564.1 transcriptional regulator, XRE family protein [Sagittula stellata E-37]